MTDVHLTRLADWLLHTIGRAVVASSILAALAGGILLAAGGPAGLAVLIGPVVFGMVLSWAEAPLPLELEEP